MAQAGYKIRLLASHHS